MITPHPTPVRNYTIGFVLSVLTTLLAFGATVYFPAIAPLAVVTLAVLQLGIQIRFFLHLSEEHSSTSMLVFTATVIGILILGTLWIMFNLSRLHIHPPTTTDLYEHGIVAPQHELK